LLRLYYSEQYYGEGVRNSSVFRLGVMAVINYLIIRLRYGYVDFCVQIIHTAINSVWNIFFVYACEGTQYGRHKPLRFYYLM